MLTRDQEKTKCVYNMCAQRTLLLFSLCLSLGLWACDDEGGGGTTVDIRPNGGDMAGAITGGSMTGGDVSGGSMIPNTEGFLARITVDDTVSGPAFAAVEDLNGDGKLDLIISSFGPVGGFTIEPGQITIYYQGETLEEWSKEDVVSDEDPLYWPNSVEVYDVDGDGDLDLTVGTGFLICEILGRVSPTGEMLPPSPCGGLFWFERDGDSWVKHQIAGPESGLFYHHGLLADLDGDGIEDLFTVGERRYFDAGQLVDLAEAQWFKGNPAGMGERFDPTPRIIGAGMGSLAELDDLDGDGDLDIVSAEFFAGFERQSFAWYEQVSAPNASNPSGSWTRHVIDDQVGPAIQFSIVENLFGDGRRVGVGSNHTQTTGDDPDPWESALFVYEIPEDPQSQWVGRQISQNIVSVSRDNQAAPGIFGVGDVDGDGKLDLLASGDGDPRVFTLLQREGESFETWVLDEGLPQAGSMKVLDLNGDGRAELLVTSYDKDVIYLYHAQEGGAHPLRLAEVPEWAETGVPGGAEMGGSMMGGSMTGGEMVGGGELPPLTGFDLNIQYTGSETGPLIVAAFTSWPPFGPPSAFEQVPNPSFPARVSFPQLAAGAYTVLAFIDVDNSGPMAATDADVQARLEFSFPNDAPHVINLDGEPVEGLEVVSQSVTRGARVTPVTAYIPMGGGRHPMILFTPGFQVASESYAPMLEGLAREGYVVLRADPPGTPFDADHLEMGADAIVALDWALSDLADHIESARIGRMGHSLGGKLSILNAANDARISAVFAIDPVDGDPSPFPNPMTRPTLAPSITAQVTVPVGLIGELTNGESANPFAPACAPSANNFQTFYAGLTSSPWLVEWELVGADHMDFVEECPGGFLSPCTLCEEGTMDPARVQSLTAQFASDFFALHLRDEAQREAALTQSPSADVNVRRR